MKRWGLVTTAVLVTSIWIAVGLSIFLFGGDDPIVKDVAWNLSATIVTGLGAMALIAFFGIYWSQATMRAAIAGFFVVIFLGVLLLPDVADFAADTLLSDFRTLLTTVIVFYFGAEAAVQATRIVQSARLANRSGVTVDDAARLLDIPGDGPRPEAGTATPDD